MPIEGEGDDDDSEAAPVADAPEVDREQVMAFRFQRHNVARRLPPGGLLDPAPCLVDPGAQYVNPEPAIAGPSIDLMWAAPVRRHRHLRGRAIL